MPGHVQAGEGNVAAVKLVVAILKDDTRTRPGGSARRARYLAARPIPSGEAGGSARLARCLAARPVSPGGGVRARTQCQSVPALLPARVGRLALAQQRAPSRSYLSYPLPFGLCAKVGDARRDQACDRCRVLAPRTLGYSPTHPSGRRLPDLGVSDFALRRTELGRSRRRLRPASRSDASVRKDCWSPLP
eukprot:scaffold93451_cov55-Phaeocystis_antarctica.AAC.3